jgi:hypothetical protein
MEYLETEVADDRQLFREQNILTRHSRIVKFI